MKELTKSCVDDSIVWSLATTWDCIQLAKQALSPKAGPVSSLLLLTALSRNFLPETTTDGVILLPCPTSIYCPFIAAFVPWGNGAS